MKDINIGGFINRFVDPNSLKKQGAVSGAQSQEAGFHIEQQPSPPPSHRPTFQASNQRPFLMNKEAISFTNADKIMLLKELLNIPKDIKDFLLMMTEQTQGSSQDMQKLMNTLLANNMDASKLIMFLQNNGKEATTKLFQMIANFNQMGASVSTDELKQLTGLINAFVPSSQTSQNHALKNLLLLYLPWLPLAENTGFQLEIGNPQEDKEKASEDSLSILISTENFGNVKVLLFKVPGDSLEVQFSCSKEFPKEEVMAELKKETDDYKLKMEIGFEENENLRLDEAKKQEQQISMNVSQKVNSFLVLMAHFVVKTVLGVDKDYSLRQKRKEML